MAFNSKKVEKMVRSMGIKAKEFHAFVYPDRSSDGSFGYLEIGNNTNPKAEAVERIADLLKCSIDELFDRDSHFVNSSSNTVTGDNNNVGNLQVNSNPEVLIATNNHLKEIIDMQDKIIEKLNNRIDQIIELAKLKNNTD